MEEDRVNILMAEVHCNEKVASGTWHMALEATSDFDVAKISPGQFICLQPLSADSVMARPFSVYKVKPEWRTFHIYYRVVGKNTLLMSRLTEGKIIKFWGPLGNRRVIDYHRYAQVWLVGGGIGIAPLLFFERVISESEQSVAKIFYGCKTKSEMITTLDSYPTELIELVTEDGYLPQKGLVTDMFAERMKYKPGRILVITCGPNPMMKRVAEICEQNKVDCYVILEKVMACGIGVCLGCSIKTTKGMKRICHDGPIFKAEEVIWNELG